MHYSHDIASARRTEVRIGLYHCAMARYHVRVNTIVLLLLSNVFMTFAWYAHLKELRSAPWLVAALISWGIALFEYLLQVPANRLGYGAFSLAQLKVMQEIIALSVFAPFAVWYMKEPLRWDFLWAALCLVAAAYFMFRGAKA